MSPKKGKTIDLIGHIFVISLLASVFSETLVEIDKLKGRYYTVKQFFVFYNILRRTCKNCLALKKFI